MHRPLLLDITSLFMHPSNGLIQGQQQPVFLPVCNHAAGLEKRMRKCLALDPPTLMLIEMHAALHEISYVPVPNAVEYAFLGLMDSELADCGAMGDSAIKRPNSSRRPLATRAKMKIAAACHAPRKITSHNGRPEICDPSAVAGVAIKAAELKEIRHKSKLHDRATDGYNGVVLQSGELSGQSLPEAAGALM